jgi:hypothetical protein
MVSLGLAFSVGSATACSGSSRTSNDRAYQSEIIPLRPTGELLTVPPNIAAAGFPGRICRQSFRGTGITAHFEEGGTIEEAQAIAFHESPKSTELHDRTSDQIDLDEIEKIKI